jgi:hypothetical protein
MHARHTRIRGATTYLELKHFTTNFHLHHTRTFANTPLPASNLARWYCNPIPHPPCTYLRHPLAQPTHATLRLPECEGVRLEAKTVDLYFDLGCRAPSQRPKLLLSPRPAPQQQAQNLRRRRPYQKPSMPSQRAHVYCGWQETAAAANLPALAGTVRTRASRGPGARAQELAAIRCPSHADTRR